MVFEPEYKIKPGNIEITMKETEEAYEKARKIANSFIDECAEQGMTIFELEKVKKVMPEIIDCRIKEIEFKTKLS